MNTADFHSVPRLSASGLPRLEKCAATHARSVELFTFVQQRRIAGLQREDDRAALMGSRLHEVLARVPYVDAALGLSSVPGAVPMDGRERRAFITAQAAAVGIEKLSVSDLWYCDRAIRARDAMISAVLGGAPQLARPLQKITFNFDQRRMEAVLKVGSDAVTTFSGLPDVQVEIVDAKGRLHAIVSDYKSGRAEHEAGDTNRQITGLVALAEWQARRQRTANAAAALVSSRSAVLGAGVALAPGATALTSVFTSTLSRSALDRAPDAEPGAADRPLKVGCYGPEQIQRAVELTRGWVTRAAKVAATLEIHFQESGNDGKLPPALADKLHEEATAGDHCLYCEGKTCCSKLQAHIREVTQTRFSPEAQVRLEDAKRVLAAHAQSLSPLQPPDTRGSVLPQPRDTTMTDTDIPLILAEAKELLSMTKLAEQVVEEGNELCRQIVERRAQEELPPIEGMKLKAGARSLKLKTRPAESGGTVELGPDEVFVALTELDGTLQKSDFVAACCEVNPNRTREFIAGRLGAPENKVFSDHLEKTLGSKNPFEMRSNRASVILDRVALAVYAATDADALPAVEVGEFVAAGPAAGGAPEVHAQAA